MMFGLALCFLRPALVIDVREHVIPSDNAVLIVTEGLPPDVNPPVDAIEAPDAMNEIQRLSDGVRSPPFVLQQLSIVRVNGIHRPLTESLDGRVQIVDSPFV